MKVNVDGNVVNIDDVIVIEKTSIGYMLTSEASMAVVGNISDQQAPTSEPEYDKTYYYGGDNYLTLEESSEKAIYKVYDEIWQDFNDDETGDIDALFDLMSEPAQTLIKTGEHGRQDVYKLAGRLKTLFNDGFFTGVPLAYVFKGVVEGNITLPEPPTPKSGFSSVIKNTPIWGGRYA